MKQSPTNRPFPRTIIVIGIIVIILVLLGGQLYYIKQRDQITDKSNIDLRAVAKLKATEIERWRQERLGDAGLVHENPLIVHHVASFITSPKDAAVRQDLLAWMHEYVQSYGYTSLLLCDSTGTVLLRTDENDSVGIHGRYSIVKAVGSGSIVFSDLYFRGDSISPSMHLAIPIVLRLKSDQCKTVVLLMRIDPYAYLYPLLLATDFAYQSLESFLVRKEGEHVVYLSELQHMPNAALRYRIPLTDTMVTSVQTIRRGEGIFVGSDYRGVEVLASVQKVVGTSWHLIVKIDREEMMAPLQLVLRTVMFTILLLIIMIAMVIAFIWRSQWASYFERQFQAEEALRISEQNLRRAQYVAQIGSWTLDVQKNSLLWSDECCAIFGVPPGTPLSYENFLAYIHPNDKNAVDAAWQAALRGSPYDIEHRIIVNGQVKWVREQAELETDGNGRILRGIGTVQDISQRRRAEETFQNIVESSPSAMYFYTLDQDNRLILTGANPAADRVIGISHSELIGKTLQEAFPNLSATELPSLYTKIAEDQLPAQHFEIPYEDNRFKGYYDVYVFLTSPRHIAVTFLDITDRKQAEIKLMESEELFAKSFSSSPLPMSLIDIETDIYLNINHAWVKMYGFPRQDVIGKRSTEIKNYVNPSDRTMIQDLLTQEGSVKDFQTAVYTKSGAVRHGRVSIETFTVGARRLMLSIFYDTTEERFAQEQLLKSQSQYRLLAENVNDVIWILDIVSRTFVYVSPSVIRLRGYTASEVMRQTIDEVMTPDSLKRVNELLPERIARYMAGDASAVTGVDEIEQTCKDGSTVWTEISTTFVKNDDGTVSVIGVSRDIRERKRAEENILKLYRLYIFISEINKLIVRAKDRDSLFDGVCSIATTTGGFRMAWIGLVDESTEMVVPAAWGGHVEGYLKDIGVTYRDVPEGNGPTGRSIRARKLVFTNDIASDPTMTPWREKALARGYRSAIGCPFIVKGTVVGAISLYSSKAGYFTAEELDLLEHVAGDISYALEALENEADRKQKEEELRLKDIVFETSVAANTIADSDGNITQVNQSALELWGYSSIDDVKGKPLRSFIRDEAVAIEVATAVRTTGRWVGEYTAQRKNGTTFDALAMATIIKDHLGNFIGFQSSVIDISAQKKLQQELALKEKQFRDLFESTIDAVYKSTHDGRFLEVNQAMVNLLGYDSREELLAVHIPTTIYFKESDRDVPRISLLRGEEAIYPLKRKDGSAVWVEDHGRYITDDDGNILYHEGILRDVTERIKAEENLRNSEERFRTLFETMVQGVIYQDTSGAIISANSAAERILGLSLDQLQGRTSKDPRWNTVREDGSDFPGDQHPSMVALRTGLPVTDVVMGVFNPIYNDTVWMNVNAIPQFQQGDSAPFQVYTTFEDITERKSTEVRLRQYARKLEEAEEITKLGSWEFNVTTGHGWWSKFMYQLLNFPEQDTVPPLENYLEHIHPEDRSIVRDAFEAMFSGRVPKSQVFRTNAAYGTERYLHPTYYIEQNTGGGPQKYNGTLLDITDQKNVELALKEQQEIYSAVVDGANESIALLDPDTGSFYSFNDTTCAALGYTRDEFSRMALKDIKVDMPEEQIPAYLNELVNTGIIQFESKHRHKDGTVLERLISTRVVTVHGRRLIASIWSDITERKRSEMKIRQLSHAVEQLASTVVITDTRGYIQYVNNAFVHVTGYSKEEVMGQRPAVLKTGHTTDAEYKQMWEAISSGQVWQGEFLNKKKNGDLYWELAVISPVKDDSGSIINYVAVKEDITERKRVEIDLQMKDSAIASSINAIVFADLEGNLTSINRAFLELWGYEKQEEVLGRPATEFWQMGGQTEEVIRALERSGKWTGELTGRKKNGTIIDVLISASMVLDKAQKPISMMGSFVDVTERKRYEAQIRQLSMAMQQASVSVVITDLNGIIVYVNEASTRTSGYSREELVGRKPSLFKSGETPSSVYDHLWKTIKAGNEWRGEFRNKRKDGTLYWESVVIAPVKDEHGTTINYIAVKDDVTERKEMQNQLLRSQRMESIGTLAGGIAHDLNNILGPILLSVQVLRMKVKDESLTNLISTIESSTIRGKNIVAQVLSFARGNESKPVLIQVRHIVKEVQDVVRQTFAKNIEIHSTVPKDLWTINADPTQIHQILMNLCVNARDAMPNGGQLTMNVRNIIVDETLISRYPEARNGRYVEIDVQDSGSGIAPDIIQKVFDPFFTTKELGKGTGLGLSTVYTIVKQHRGFITVQSVVGEGTVFKVFLPASDESPAVEEQHRENIIQSGNRESILVVDDELAIQSICRETLEFYNYSVATAANGAEGISKFVRGNDLFHVVLIDMMMPVMDGKTAAAAIKKIDPEVRIIGMSGLISELNTEGEERFFSHFLRKPFTGKELMDAVNKVMK